MKSSSQPRTVLLALACAWAACNVQAQSHGHLQIAADSTAQDAQLYFYNGADFASTSGYVKTLIFTNSGQYGGYFQGNITFTVQAATPDYGGPEPDAPALGSHIRATVLSVEGPAGGAFGFWESGAMAPTINLASGESGTNSFAVSQTDGSAGVDPFGHIHGRRFTLTEPGIYRVAFQAFDDSNNGTGGGPIHTPSEPITIVFQAGINIASLTSGAGSATVSFGSMSGQSYVLEGNSDLNNAAGWTAVAGPVVGNDYFRSLTDSAATNSMTFYRVKSVVSP